jgi:hypothetical protein
MRLPATGFRRCANRRCAVRRGKGGILAAEETPDPVQDGLDHHSYGPSQYTDRGHTNQAQYKQSTADTL